MAGYSTATLAKKLGFKENFRAAIRNPPEGFARALGSLPKGTTLVSHTRGKFDLVLLFARREAKLKMDFARWVARLKPAGMLWVAWPKKTAKVPTDLDFNMVQKIGLETGLVDNKICAVDDTWSGLRFVRRVKDR